MFQKYKKNTGFTLIELLVVIAIFALIANLTMVALNNAKRESRDAKRVSNINQLRSALHLYHTSNLSYPDDGGSPIALGTDNNLILDRDGWIGANPTSPIYMYSIPRDPRMIAAPAADPCTVTSVDICDYSYDLGIDDYVIYFYLEDSVGDMSAGLHTATKDTIL